MSKKKVVIIGGGNGSAISVRAIKQFKEDSLSNAGDFFEDINSWWQELEIPGRIPGEVAKCSRDELADKAFEDACHQDNPVACTREMFYSWYGDLWPN